MVNIANPYLSQAITSASRQLLPSKFRSARGTLTAYQYNKDFRIWRMCRVKIPAVWSTWIAVA